MHYVMGGHGQRSTFTWEPHTTHTKKVVQSFGTKKWLFYWKSITFVPIIFCLFTRNEYEHSVVPRKKSYHSVYYLQKKIISQPTDSYTNFVFFFFYFFDTVRYIFKKKCSLLRECIYRIIQKKNKL